MQLQPLPLDNPSAIVIIELAGAPVGKGRARFVRATGHAYTPGRTAGYETQLRLAAGDAMEGRAPLDGPIRLVVEALLPIPASWSLRKRAAALQGQVRPTGRPDVDNYLKAALDAMNTVVFHDDSQVIEVTVRKAYDPKPRLRIAVMAVAG